MDPAEETIALALRHVNEAEQRVEKQQAVVTALRRDGRDTTDAERLLATFRDTLAVMREHLEYEQSKLDVERR